MSEKIERTSETGGIGSAPAFDAGFAGLQQRARYHTRQMIDHLWGPTGSIILHILILIALVRLVAIGGREVTPEFESMLIEPETVELEDLQRELEMLPDVDIDVAPPDADIRMEDPMEQAPRDPTPREDVAALDIMTDVRSPLVMRGLFAGRDAAGRSAMLNRFAPRGRASALDAAVNRALEWLKENQLEDGSWQGEGRASNRAAMTGLGLLTFLSHGETPGSSERYGETVAKAIRYLSGIQDGRGAITDGGFNAYAHGIATYALAEAFALTRIPSLQPVVEQAMTRTIRGMQPTGGYTYSMSGTETRRDTSVAGWQAQAMKAAYLAGLNVEGLEAAMERAAAGFLLNYGASNRMFAYAPDAPGRPERGRASTTAMAVLCLQLLGQGAAPEVQAGIESLADRECEWGSNATWGTNHVLYSWYYQTQAMFHQGGRPWDRWNNRFSAAFLRAQNADGSWTPFSGNEAAYGPVYGTTFSALSLMVYYRYLPTYQPIEIEAAPTHESDQDIQIEIL